MQVSIFTGEIADAKADAVCTSTNPRLSLMMGTGSSIRERGGFEVLRACEELLENEHKRTGRASLPIGSAHATTAGALPFKAAIHCVASDATHHLSSPEIIRACVKSALRVAEAKGFASLAMPVFATGHARVRFDLAVTTMADALRDAKTTVRHVTLVVLDRERSEEAQKILDKLFA
ncbi:MAG TPA: macro domain-containing protein [Thermoanaerobaculia bacterium]|nr:macro domain-containing protein [Thermoanaerobaculia bacterium]